MDGPTKNHCELCFYKTCITENITLEEQGRTVESYKALAWNLSKFAVAAATHAALAPTALEDVLQEKILYLL